MPDYYLNHQCEHTMRDRVLALGYPYPGKHMAWALGQRIREKWVWHPLSGGELPEKGLRSKVSQRGSHCFALYPTAFVPVMDQVIHAMLNSAQGWLPFPEPEDGEEDGSDT